MKFTRTDVGAGPPGLILEVPVAENRCQQCEKPISQPRGGSRAKRFCCGACRARFNRARRPRAIAPVEVAPSVGLEERRAVLEALYELLRVDVNARGVVLPDGRLNPTAAELRRVVVELGRLGEPAVSEPPVEEDEIARILHRSYARRNGGGG